LDVGATLFIGNLDPEVDEKMLYDTFSAFGMIVNTPRISRDPETGGAKGFGFISFDNFESSDAAIDAMEGQYLMNKQITVSYAFKKDGKGERHGSAAERLLAAEARKNVQMPNRLYSGGPAMAPVGNVQMQNTQAMPMQPMMGYNGFAPPPPPPGPPMGYAPRPPMGYPAQQMYGNQWQ
jgi:splicing factor 3B subunit 4